jgi:hypothetical protein
MDYLEFIARVTSHIPDQGQVTVRYYGLYANAHRGKIKARQEAFPLRMAEEELRPVPAKGWAEMIRKVYELVSTQIDKREAFDLPSPTMGRGKIGVMNTHQASAAKNELLIFSRPSKS